MRDSRTVIGKRSILSPIDSIHPLLPKVNSKSPEKSYSKTVKKKTDQAGIIPMTDVSQSHLSSYKGYHIFSKKSIKATKIPKKKKQRPQESSALALLILEGITLLCIQFTISKAKSQ